MTVKAHEIIDEGVTLAWVHPASALSVEHVLAQPDTLDGRSPWVWLRLPNGDLILGVFPRGDTYFSVEGDAEYPYSEVARDAD